MAAKKKKKAAAKSTAKKGAAKKAAPKGKAKAPKAKKAAKGKGRGKGEKTRAQALAEARGKISRKDKTPKLRVKNMLSDVQHAVIQAYAAASREMAEWLAAARKAADKAAAEKVS